MVSRPRSSRSLRDTGRALTHDASSQAQSLQRLIFDSRSGRLARLRNLAPDAEAIWMAVSHAVWAV